MATKKRVLAAVEFILISPAVLFMTALMVRSLTPLELEPAHTAQRIVMWYAARMWTLWVLLLALPGIVLSTGLATLLLTPSIDLPPQGRARPMRTALYAQPLIAAASSTAAVILVIVILHMAAN